MSQAERFSNLQLELLKLFNYQLSDKQLKDVRSLLTKYFAQNVTEGIEEKSTKNDWQKFRGKFKGKLSTVNEFNQNKSIEKSLEL